MLILILGIVSTLSAVLVDRWYRSDQNRSVNVTKHLRPYVHPTTHHAHRSVACCYTRLHSEFRHQCERSLQTDKTRQASSWLPVVMMTSQRQFRMSDRTCAGMHTETREFKAKHRAVAPGAQADVSAHVVAATARVRSSGSNQTPSIECVAGIVTPSPRPISTRQHTKGPTPKLADSGVSSVKKLHTLTPHRSTALPPQRAEAQPPSTCVRM